MARHVWPRVRAAFVLTLILLAAGCVSEPAPDDTQRENTQTDEAGLRPVTMRFEGRATATPATPFEQSFTFEVPRGAVGVNGTLAWSAATPTLPLSAARGFDLALLDPRGETIATGYRDVEGHLVVASIDPPRPGEWTFIVKADAAADVPFTLDAQADLIVPEHNLLTRTIQLGQASFYEVNLILEANASFVFSFNGSAPLRWDIHSHPPEGLKEWETGEGTRGNATFTAPAREVYSIMWENPQALPATLSFEVDGRFRVHSHSG